MNTAFKTLTATVGLGLAAAMFAGEASASCSSLDQMTAPPAAPSETPPPAQAPAHTAAQTAARTGSATAPPETP